MFTRIAPSSIASEMPLDEIGERTYALHAGGGGATTVLVCCSVGFGQPAAHPLLELMPPLLLIRGGALADPVLPTLLDAMASEVLERRIGAATLMAEPWSVESLAAVAGASRSILSERFAKLVGMPPARYVARWRMHVASGWLENERASVDEVASRLGYESEAAFSRAFKRFVGVPPSSLRRG